MLKKIKRYWLPVTLPALAAWMANFALKFEQFAVALGFKTVHIEQVNNINATVQWLLDGKTSIDANVKGFNKYRDDLIFLDKDDPEPIPPVTAMPEQPTVIIWGIADILDNLVGQIRLANNYTDEIGAQLGILPPPPDNISPENVKPVGQFFAAAGGFEMAVVVTNRAEADMSVLQIRIVGQEKWLNAKTFTGKGTSYVYMDAPDEKPLQIQARIQLMRKNQTYGQPSDSVYVTLNP